MAAELSSELVEDATGTDNTVCCHRVSKREKAELAVWGVSLRCSNCPLENRLEPLFCETTDTALFNHQPLGYFFNKLFPVVTDN